VSWLAGYVYPSDACNPFKTPGFYHAMSIYATLPGSLYGAIERAGEKCGKYEPAVGKHYFDRTLIPIDCDPGPGVWYCMTYCD
jgi:hypothetical protein